MTKHWIVAAVLIAGCSKGKKTEETSTGSATPQAAKPQRMPLPAMPALELPDDPKRKEKIELGHNLFFDKRLSGKGDLACYDCHKNEDGNGGHDPIAIGSGGVKQTRHAPTLWNVGYWKNAGYWDGRAPTLEENTKGAWGGGNMGAGKDNLDKKAAEIAAIPGYKKLFEDAFGKTEIKADQVAQALSEYMRTFVCNDTAYDKFAAGEKSALSDQQQRGLDVFLGKGMCITCHSPPFFSTAMNLEGGAYFNVGVGTDVAEDQVDVGRMKVSNQPVDWAAFKPPSLRNITKTPPYFHNGSAAKLEDAVKIMATGGIKNKNLTPIMADRALTPAEMGDLVSFLGGLECQGKLDAPAALPK
ncbi:MAG TPA: cytochrome c peroxidase [Kofleriaceae bacterium]|nr:cytochrome c peroxidase [Kofleriaceae bacterium]